MSSQDIVLEKRYAGMQRAGHYKIDYGAELIGVLPNPGQGTVEIRLRLTDSKGGPREMDVLLTLGAYVDLAEQLPRLAGMSEPEAFDELHRVWSCHSA